MGHGFPLFILKVFRHIGMEKIMEEDHKKMDKEKIKEFWKKNKNKILITIFEMLGAMLILSTFTQMKESSKRAKMEEVTYQQFMEYVTKGMVDTVWYSSPSSEYLEFTLLNEDTKNMSLKQRERYAYPNDSWRKVSNPQNEGFRHELLLMGVNVRKQNNVSFLSLFITFLSFSPTIFLIYLMWKMMAGQFRGINKDEIIQESNTKFDNVIGQDEILEDIKFITKLIKDPSLGEKIGVKVPKGILLSGAPGTGKTLIAKAIAGEAGVPFVSMSGSDFKELFVGMGAKRVRDLFSIARKNSPCIVFIDEIDAVGAARDSHMASSSEDSQTINALLKEMDGFTGREGVFVLAATNYPDKLDSALRRSGRFDREIHVNPPRDWKTRADLFRYYLRDAKLSDDVDIDALSKQVAGFTGADISMICNEAGIIALMNDKDVIDQNCIEEAIDKKIFHGNRAKNQKLNEDLKIVAYHEAGHAVMTWLCGEEISRASIQGTTSGIGGVVFGADGGSVFQTKKYLENRIMIAFAGRASEELKFGPDNVTTGASNDITQATNVMYHYIQKEGFDEKYGLLDLEVLGKNSLISADSVAEKIAVMSREMYQRTIALLRERYDLVEKLAIKLLEEETVSGIEIKTLLEEE